MIQRYEVRGAGGARLAAWDFAMQPTAHPAQASASGSGSGSVAAASSAADSPGPSSNGSADGRPNVLMLHGLLGRASHWAATARRLAPRYRALALDQRGHGRSDKPDGPYTPDAYTADAIAAIEQLDLAPVTLIGHSVGALTAWQCAARRPDLVAAVVICDMRASPFGEAAQRKWLDWLESWPLPFATLGDVRRWFTEAACADRPNPVRGDYFAEVMEEHQDGWRPLCAPEQLVRARDPWIGDAHWDELAQVGCPALVVRGLDGLLGRAEAQEMVRVLPRGRYAEIADAGHLVPWDQPEAWYATVEGFLAEAVGPASSVLGSAGAA
ncbi:Pimeloyl-ACP methyl ester carboxylesterase [Streptomyces sp. DvalAA-14]|uniref:alpha/beta fold hydrolase n=1 Tax=unclassified Streptomyces TaxID=2593676 RepID=UPI00081B820A|nr:MULTISPECIES: alpha/beta hydrolase [unclassified Streptomyces]MYS24378.1 alpha/beta fold hydrolase [Streptomyces sp. SID4948]SCE45424.1 Pimeloyl-ACP methyl ester carboxylesterase [Streptomyces sp. DvalAA-14]